jgi:rhamnosyltransferase
MVTHHPGGRLGRHGLAVLPQVDRLIVVDNGSAAAALGALAGREGVELVRNAENLGVGTALNQGARRAAELGYAWLLMLDQDTEVDPDLLAGLAEAYGACPFKERVKILAANYRIPSLGRTGHPEGAAPFSRAVAANTSGSLLSLAAFAEAGPLRDDFFIDLVDTEYCLRLRSLGYEVVVTSRALMTHEIGSGFARRIFGRVRNISNHSPARRYYMTRNRVAMARAYLWREPRWVAMEMVRAAAELVAMARFEQDRLAKARAAAAGLWDGLRGRLGRADRFPSRPAGEGR